MVNPPLLLHYVHKKVTRGPEVATFGTKTLNFTRVTHINWLAKIKFSGPGPFGRQYYCSLFLHACMLSRKMLKETETTKTIGFFVTFLSLMAFQLGGGGADHLPPSWPGR